MDEVIVHVLGGYIASQCQIVELNEHTYFVILELFKFCNKQCIGYRQTWRVWVHDIQPFIRFH